MTRYIVVTAARGGNDRVRREMSELKEKCRQFEFLFVHRAVVA